MKWVIYLNIIQDTLSIEGKEFYTINVALPKTNLLIIGNDVGFVMCGALDVGIYNTPKMKERGVVCAKVVGVRSIDDMLNAFILEASDCAMDLGITKGVAVFDALKLLS